jgi:hypothetical protein
VPPAGHGAQRLKTTVEPADPPVALIEDHVRLLDRVDRVDADRHDGADAFPAVVDPEDTAVGNFMGAAVARKCRFPTAAGARISHDC